MKATKRFQLKGDAMANDHQLFEEWLFSHEDLSHEEVKASEEHLKTCDSCLQLSIAWGEVEDEIQVAPILSPAAGFTERWRTRLAADRLKRQHRLNISILFLCVGGAALFLIVSSVMIIPLFKSPWPFILTWTYQLATLFSMTSVYGGALTTLIRTLVKIVPPMFWVTLPLAFSFLLIIWLLYYQKILLSRRIML
jgi:hypothetical protein